MTEASRREALARRVAALGAPARDALARAVAAEGGSVPSRLVACLVPSHPAPAAAELEAFLRERLPEHMIPSRLVLVDVLPRTAVGKLDRDSVDPLRGRPLASSAPPRLVLPRDDAERTLAGIWQEVLGVDRIGIHDDFFELGGDSLLSIRAISRAGRAGLTIRPDDFFERPTIAGLAEAVRAAAAPADAPAATGPLVTLRTSGDAPSLYAVSGVGGGIAQLVPLSRALSGERPFRAFQAPGLDGEEAPLRSIEAIADEFVDAMLGDADQGVHLLGGCWGGAVVHAMAVRLAREGRPPLSVAILEPPLLPRMSVASSSSSTWTFLRGRLALYAREFRDLDWAGRRRFVVRKAAAAVRILRAGTLPEETRLERAHADVLAANRAAIERYRPEPFEARARVFFASDHGGPGALGDYREAFLDLLVPRPGVVPVPGRDLVSVLSEHPQAFAAALEAWLREVDHVA